MPKLQENLAVAYGSVAADLMKRLGDAQAAQAGPPVSEEVEPATDEKRVTAWNARRPEATDEAMMQMARERYQEHLRAGMDPEKAQRATAEDLTHFRYGKRLQLYTDGQIGFQEQVKEAARLAKLAQRKTTPDPMPPAPTMPSARLTNAATMQPSMMTEPAPAAPATSGMPPPATSPGLVAQDRLPMTPPPPETGPGPGY